MKKIILKIILSIFLFLWLSSFVNASIEPFSDIWWVSYDWTNITLSNNWHTKIVSFDLWSFSSELTSNWRLDFFWMNNDNSSALRFYLDSNWRYFIYNLSGYSFSKPILYDINLFWVCIDTFSYRDYRFISHDNSEYFLGWSYISCSNSSSSQFNFNNSAILNNWEYIINWVLYSWTPEVSNQTCKEVFTTDENKFDYNYKEEYTTFIDYLDEDRAEWLFQYWYEDNKFLVSIENVEDLYWFSGSLINEWNSSFVFNNRDSPLADNPTLELNSDLSYVNYFQLNSVSWSDIQKVYWINDNWDIVKILDFIDEDENKNFEFNKLYYFPYFDNLKWFKFIFWNIPFSWDVDIKTDFWKIVKTQDVHEVCYDEETNENITVDWESYTWALDQIWRLDVENIDRSDTTDINYISWSGGLEKSFEIFNDKFWNTFDNLDSNLSFSWVEQKLSIIKDNIDNRLNLNVNNTCEMFNDDLSFKSYWTLDISLNFNILQNNSFDYLLYVPQKFINFATNPLNNLLSLTAVFENFEDNQEICFLWFEQKVEFQKMFKEVNEGVKIPNMNNQDLVVIWEQTIIDYFILVVFWIIFVFGMITVFSRLY